MLIGVHGYTFLAHVSIKKKSGYGVQIFRFASNKSKDLDSVSPHYLQVEAFWLIHHDGLPCLYSYLKLPSLI